MSSGDAGGCESPEVRIVEDEEMSSESDYASGMNGGDQRCIMNKGMVKLQYAKIT